MPLDTQELEEPPYDSGYSSGTFVGTVNQPLPSGWEYEEPKEGILIVAKEWKITGQNFEINFDLTSAFQKYGEEFTLFIFKLIPTIIS